MGDDDKGVLVVLQIAREPGDVLLVEVVRRLVENQDFGILQQELREQYLRALAARELVHLALEADIAQAEAARHLLDTRINGVVAARIQYILDSRRLLHHLIHFLRRRLAHLVIEREHLLLQFRHVIEGRAQHLADGHARRQRSMLVEIAHFRAPRPLHGARVRRHAPRDDSEERRLALAVRPHEGHVFPFQQAERNILEDLPPAVAVRKM